MAPWFKTLAVGAGAGATVALVAWWLAERELDASFTEGAAQLQQATGTGRQELTRRLAQGRRQLDERVRLQVERTVPQQVQASITRTLGSYGITPETGRLVTTALAAAHRVGLLGVGGH